MQGVELMDKINETLLDKLAKLDQAQDLMQSLDESLDQVLLLAAVERTEQLFKQVQHLDLVFLNTLQRFLTVNGVGALDELPVEGLRPLKHTQELILKVESLMKDMEALMPVYLGCKQTAERFAARAQSHVKAKNAYGKFTKK